MSEPPKKFGPAFWGTVILLAPLLYLSSFGPACWIAFRWQNPVYRKTTERVYFPLLMLSVHEDSPRPIRRVLSWYVSVGRPALSDE
jgi:hypothetical protein